MSSIEVNVMSFSAQARISLMERYSSRPTPLRRALPRWRESREMKRGMDCSAFSPPLLAEHLSLSLDWQRQGRYNDELFVNKSEASKVVS